MVDDMLEKIVSKAEESMEKALHHANKTDGNKVTNILNAEYHMGEFNAYMEMIEDISLDMYVEIGEKTKETRQIVLEAIDKIYGYNNEFTNEELQLLSDGMLALIDNSCNALQLVRDKEVINALFESQDRYNELNDKICAMLEGSESNEK